MEIEITSSITDTDRNELFKGLRSYNQQFICTADWGQFGIYARNESGEMMGGLISSHKG
jgi:hypothetical protein